MANKAQATSQAQGVDAARQAEGVQKANQVDQVRQLNQVGKLEKAQLNKTNANLSNNLTAKAMDPVTQKQNASRATNMISQMVGDMEKGQGALDKLISNGISSKNMSMPQMLALQAGMYKYTQELDLTGKVVQQATTGLKDTLKTQV